MTEGIDITVKPSSDHAAYEALFENEVDGVPLRVSLSRDSARQSLRRALKKEGLEVGTSKREREIGVRRQALGGMTGPEHEIFLISPHKTSQGCPDFEATVDVLKAQGAEFRESPFQDETHLTGVYKGAEFEVLPLYN